MCVITERGNQCLLDWGRWVSVDSTVRRLGYPGRSAEQSADHVRGHGDHAVNPVAELVDKIVAGLLEERKRQVVRLFYVDRLPMEKIVVSLICLANDRPEAAITGKNGRVSVDVVKADLCVIRAAVGSVMMWCY